MFRCIEHTLVQTRVNNYFRLMMIYFSPTLPARSDAAFAIRAGGCALVHSTLDGPERAKATLTVKLWLQAMPLVTLPAITLRSVTLPFVTLPAIYFMTTHAHPS